MKSIYILFLFFFLIQNLNAQPDTSGSGHAIQFDGIDDYIDLGNIYDNLTLPFTVSAWVKLVPGSAPGPVLVSQDNAPLYNGFWFLVGPTHIGIEYGDGGGENNSAFRTGRSADGIPDQSGRWVHVCATMRSGRDVSLYINGIDVGGVYGGGSSLPMSSNYPLDVAKIGYFLSNGTIYRFKGAMDELRIYNRDVPLAEIRQTMYKKLTGTENGLIGYWTFDEATGNILKDKSSNHFDGQLLGDAERIYSDAPVGDIP